MAKGKRIHQPYNKFKVWLKDNNLTYADVGDVLGITKVSVMLKINGQSDFWLSEIQLLKEKYHLTDDIFSTQIVA